MNRKELQTLAGIRLREAQVLFKSGEYSGATIWLAMPPIIIMKTTEPFVRALRKVFGKTEGVAGMRLGGQMWGDRFVEGAYAYKIA